MLWLNLMVERAGEVSNICCSTSTIALCDKSSTWRDSHAIVKSATCSAGSTNAPEAMVCSWLYERLRWVRDGRPTNTKEWRTWGSEVGTLQVVIGRSIWGEKGGTVKGQYY